MVDNLAVFSAILTHTTTTNTKTPQLKERLHCLLFAYKDMFAEHWNAFYATVPLDVRHVLESSYFGGQ
jgi:hypothetical protein